MIKNCVIYGERCSGTNYLTDVMQLNFHVNILEKEYDWKHFFGFADLSHSDDTLFICIIRNPIDWINSLYNSMHHLCFKKYNLENDTKKKRMYLNNEIYSYVDDPNLPHYGKEIMKDRHIYTKDRYKNIFELRYTKLKYMHDDLPKKVKNCIIIKYEELQYNFKDVMNSIKNKYDIPVKVDNFPINTKEDKKHGNTYLKKKKKEYIKKEAILYHPHFDNNFEKKIGYIDESDSDSDSN